MKRQLRYVLLSKYKKEFSRDGYFEFGLLYQDENKLTEVFVKKAKYIQYWGTDKDAFIEIMSAYSLYEDETINFIDEFPMVTESLVLNDSSTTDTHRIVDDLYNSFSFR